MTAQHPTAATGARDALAERVVRAIAGTAERDAAMATTVGLLKESVPAYTWVGIYLLVGNELVLGPFEGKPTPHIRIPLGRGICGAAATERTTIIVDDVTTDPRYLACSSDTRSEIVVPILHGADVLGEIDIDSDLPAAFGPADRVLLERIAAALAPRLAAGSADHA
jgi:L-methionine (R)-S-oxide reductase